MTTLARVGIGLAWAGYWATFRLDGEEIEAVRGWLLDD